VASSELSICLEDGVRIVVPPTLDAITTYVLLEQEAWFEKELALLRRWLRPGMTALDIGANVGVYSLPIARLVAPDGRVFAYEPASEPRQMLERSRSLGEFHNLTIEASALTDRRGSARLARAASSELSTLAGAGEGEEVELTTLDAEDDKGMWGSPDFVKIDAEGEESRIIAGGVNFFARHSPLVMFEIKQEAGLNTVLLEAFRSQGYDLFRMLPGASLLAPFSAQHAIDPYELNLFAAKPDRAAALARAGLLVTEVAAWSPDADAWRHARDLMRSQPFARAFPAVGREDAPPSEYAVALMAYACWRRPDIPVETRIAALAAAYRCARAACRDAFSFARYSTLGRIAWELGERAACVRALEAFVARAPAGELVINEPFWPACSRYDQMDPGREGGNWLIAATVEQLERARAHSSYFAASSWTLDWLCNQRFAASEMERRRVLQASRAGKRPRVPLRLLEVAADHRNADIWRGGLVPGTSLA
jgi:FkbM family methyltransferase